MIVSALNPKTALFFLAFLPQFVDPQRGHAALQAAVLGVVFIAIATFSDAIWALGSGSFATLLRASARARRVERYASGGILIGLGVLATLAHPPPGTAAFRQAGRHRPAPPCAGEARDDGPCSASEASTTSPASAKMRCEPSRPACSGSAASRIGTAPLRPPAVANSASPCVRRNARSAG